MANVKGYVYIRKHFIYRLITKQTPPDGIPVSKVMVAEAIDITRETYFCIVMDREHNGPVIVASPDGGVDIEEVAEKTPERILKMPVDIHTGVTDDMAKELAVFLGFSKSSYLLRQCTEQIKNLYQMFLEVDCLQLEVNPLAETPQGLVRYSLLYYLGSFFKWNEMLPSSGFILIDIDL